MGGGAPMGLELGLVRPVREVPRPDQRNIPLPELQAVLPRNDLQFIRRDSLAPVEGLHASMARDVKQNAARPDRRDGGRVSGGRTGVPKMSGRRAAEPMVILADGHMGERVDMRAGMRGRQNVLTHIAEPGLIAGPPRLSARHSNSLRRPI